MNYLVAVVAILLLIILLHSLGVLKMYTNKKDNFVPYASYLNNHNYLSDPAHDFPWGKSILNEYFPVYDKIMTIN